MADSVQINKSLFTLRKVHEKAEEPERIAYLRITPDYSWMDISKSSSYFPEMRGTKCNALSNE